jgi:hypothetical protein
LTELIDQNAVPASLVDYFEDCPGDFLASNYSHFITKFETLEETLPNSDIKLTSFLFPKGSNVYAFSYLNNEKTKHTLIDTGDLRYISQIEGLLESNNINIPDIENIILTHHHADHCGLVKLLAEKSRAKIIVPDTFRHLVEDGYSDWEKDFKKHFDPTALKGANLDYRKELYKMTLDGMDFPVLAEVTLAASDRLIVMGCPESNYMHSKDQQFILYSVNCDYADGKKEVVRPGEGFIFTGDLWLMESPFYKPDIKLQLNYNFRRLVGIVKYRRNFFNAREQDVEAKEALKKAFTLIRVKPGHGKEFIGSRILPNSIMSKREMREFLRSSSRKNSSSITDGLETDFIMNQCYHKFCDELIHWKSLGYSDYEIAYFLVRIFREQTGGKGKIKQDRIERKELLLELLRLLCSDPSVLIELRQVGKQILRYI